MTHFGARLLVCLALTTTVWACNDDSSPSAPAEVEAGSAPRDSRPDGLFADFIDGKFDSAGHPTGAIVFEAEGACAGTTGTVEELGVGAAAGRDLPGTLCGAVTEPLGKGTFTASARLLLVDKPTNGDVAVIRLLDADGDELASRTVASSDFPAALVYQNVAVSFTSYGDEPVTIEVQWLGEHAVRLDYVEIFRATSALVIEPVSGVLEADADLQIEMVDPPLGVTFNVLCDQTPLTDRLAQMLEDGDATVVDTEFRRIVTAPAALLLDGCPRPTRVRVSAMTGSGWTHSTSRVTWYDEPLPCEFEGDPDGTKVILTGFEPFPADSFRDNSSEHAVQGFDVSKVAGIQILKVTLPVEYDTAPNLLADLVDRCEPEIVIGFGQGRSAVDLETTAYNRKDTAEISGGAPDNRGIIFGGDPIDPEGDAERKTLLPAGAIVSDLNDAEIEARESDDPGRYVCNNLFYAIMASIDPSVSVGGFVHLPRIPSVDVIAQQELDRTVEIVVRDALRTHNDL